MIMFGLYRTGDVPFQTVYLHSMVTDEKGAKMSKSKGNVINPISLVEKYGADALRIALVAGSAPGNPIALSENKVKGYRNFANKLWNIARFLVLKKDELGEVVPTPTYTEQDIQFLSDVDQLVSSVTKNLDTYRFSDAAQGLYDFIWNDLANTYLEISKTREDKDVVFSTLVHAFTTNLKLLHPFMPFVTEAIWQEFKKEKIVEDEMLMKAEWPTE
jgi:valyl-tRNA synthetase